MVVIPEPAPGTRDVLVMTASPPVPFAKGTADVDYVCGSCHFTLVQRLRTAAQLQNAVLKCPRCGAHNEPRT